MGFLFLFFKAKYALNFNKKKLCHFKTALFMSFLSFFLQKKNRKLKLKYIKQISTNDCLLKKQKQNKTKKKKKRNTLKGIKNIS